MYDCWLTIFLYIVLSIKERRTVTTVQYMQNLLWLLFTKIEIETEIANSKVCCNSTTAIMVLISGSQGTLCIRTSVTYCCAEVQLKTAHLHLTLTTAASCVYTFTNHHVSLIVELVSKVHWDSLAALAEFNGSEILFLKCNCLHVSFQLAELCCMLCIAVSVSIVTRR